MGGSSGYNYIMPGSFRIPAETFRELSFPDSFSLGEVIRGVAVNSQGDSQRVLFIASDGMYIEFSYNLLWFNNWTWCLESLKF